MTKTVLITGATSGIGKACALLFAQEGSEVMIASRDAVALQAASEEIKAGCGATVRFKAADLSQRGAAESLAEWAGPLDVLVNNAGAIPGGDLLTVDEDTWRNAWDLKVFGYINLSRAVYRDMKSRRSGVIVNVLGVAGEKLTASYRQRRPYGLHARARRRVAQGRHPRGWREPGPGGHRPADQAVQAARARAVRRREPPRRILQGHGVRPAGDAGRNREYGGLHGV